MLQEFGGAPCNILAVPAVSNSPQTSSTGALIEPNNASYAFAPRS